MQVSRRAYGVHLARASTFPIDGEGESYLDCELLEQVSPRALGTRLRWSEAGGYALYRKHISARAGHFPLLSH